jgi:hypothetical protein
MFVIGVSSKGSTTLVAPAPRRLKSPSTIAARTIQKYWRYRFVDNTTAKLVDHALNELNITIDHVKSISFDSLVVFLRDKPVIAAMKAALQRMHMLSTFRHGSPSKSLAPENVNVRVFLAAFMIGYRPTHVFESMGTLEQQVFESAVPMLSQFETMCKTLLAAPRKHFQMVPADQTKDFPTALFEYLRRFKTWKIPDEAKLTCRIKNALIALYDAEKHLPPDEPEDSKLKIEFREQITRLRGKLQQIAGKEAVDKFDEDRLICAPVVEGSSTNAAPGAYAALPGRMTNEQLAHELLLDPTFQLDESGGCNVGDPVFRRIRESFHKAFWESLVDDLKLERPCYVRVLRVLKEICDGIVDLAGAREEGNITEIIDHDFIQMRAETGNYSFIDAMSLVRGVVGVIQRVQAPIRDTETKEKWAALQEKIYSATIDTGARVTCDCLEFLLERVNIMRIDAANARLRLISPVIRDHGADYERGKFEDKLKNGTLTLERTTAWFERTMTVESDLTKLARDGCRVSALKLHAAAIVSLVSGAVPVKADTVPETLVFDAARLATIHQQFSSLLAFETAVTVVALRNDSALLERVSAIVRSMPPGAPLDIADLGLPPVVKTHVEIELQPDSRVGNALRKKFIGVLQQSIVSGVPASCGQRCVKIARELSRLAVLNRDVHIEIYNKIIQK